MSTSARPTERFSNRVADYINYRPRYPAGVLEVARDMLRLRTGDVVADIGSGTGFLSELFLANGNTVYGVEPNREMREAGEKFLDRHANFRSVDGAAEATTLPDASVDFVTAGQAFHWFDAARAKAEFKRILKPGGHIMLVWNQRSTESTPFLDAYEKFLRDYGTDYESVCHRAVAANDEKVLHEFFAPDPMGVAVIPEQAQRFDFEGLKGRVLSSSYMPAADDPRYEEMVAALRDLFDRYQSKGLVALEYDTVIYYDRPGR
jgi:ubiquinone/menaquinone biosynthesis C-methylase UbiE